MQRSPLNLILNAESLQMPLTGIGLYTRHLIEELSVSEEVGNVWCFMRSRLLDARSCLDQVDNTSHTQIQRQDRKLSFLTAVMSRTTFPYRFYQFINNRTFRRLTQPLGSSCIYHEPNYILKPFSGPAVITVHDLSVLHYPAFHPKARVQHITRNLPQSLHRATHVVTDSNYVRSELLAHYSLPEEKVTAIPLGVSGLFQPVGENRVDAVLCRYGITAGRYLLCVATREPRKNLDRLIDAYKALPAGIKHDFSLILVGSLGWQSAELTARMRDQSGTGTIRSLGYVPREDLPALYSGASLLAFPSIYEGFGLPVLEAMACGTPVVTSRKSSMTEIVKDAAVLIDPYDSMAIRDGLLAVLEDEDLRKHLSTEGVERAKAFTWRRCAEAHLEVFRKVL